MLFMIITLRYPPFETSRSSTTSSSRSQSIVFGRYTASPEVSAVLRRQLAGSRGDDDIWCSLPSSSSHFPPFAWALLAEDSFLPPRPGMALLAASAALRCSSTFKLVSSWWSAA